MPSVSRPVQQVTLVDLAAHPAVRAGLVLDLRPPAVFARAHIRGAMSWPLAGGSDDEIAAVLDRDLPSIFLPARHEPLLVLAAEAALARQVARALQRRGRRQTDFAAWPDRAPGPTGVPMVSGDRQGCLWSPPAFLRQWHHLLPPPAAGPVLDLACGSGRAAVWLAARGWQVTAIDHQREALDLGRRLAAAAGVGVGWREADLRSPAALPAGPWAVVLLFRYLERDLLARLPGVLAAGSVVMLRTFRDCPGYIGNPQPRHRLRPAEAARFWPSDQATVLVHDEGFDADGKPAAGLVARWTGRRP